MKVGETEHPILLSLEIVFAELKERDLLIADVGERLDVLHKEIPKALRKRWAWGFWTGMALPYVISWIISGVL